MSDKILNSNYQYSYRGTNISKKIQRRFQSKYVFVLKEAEVSNSLFCIFLHALESIVENKTMN